MVTELVKNANKLLQKKTDSCFQAASAASTLQTSPTAVFWLAEPSPSREIPGTNASKFTIEQFAVC